MLKSSITTSSLSSIQHVPSVSSKRRAVTFREQHFPAPRTHRGSPECTAVAANGDDDSNNNDATATADLRLVCVNNNHHTEDEDAADDDDDFYYRKEKWNPNNYSNPMYNDNYDDDDDDDDVSLQLDDIFPQVTTCSTHHCNHLNNTSNNSHSNSSSGYRGGAICTAPTARIHLLHGTRNLNFEFELDDDDNDDNDDDDDENDWTPSESSSLSYTSMENTMVDGTNAATATTATTTFDTLIHHNESTFAPWENETSLSSLLEEHLQVSLHDVNLPNKVSTTTTTTGTTTKQPSQLSIHELSTTTVENTSFQSLPDDGLW
jgi:hypothetical protein